jgi:hypothetical protein
VSDSDDEGPKEWLTKAINLVAACDGDLWTLRVNERTRVSQVFYRLRAIVPREWDVDTEWSRQGKNGDRKFLGSSLATDRTGIPDLIIHHRGQFGPDHNLLVAEFKLDVLSLSSSSPDFQKITYWRSAIGYQYGALVSLGDQAYRPRMMWFEDGARDGAMRIESF